jgi:hypothetical protein
VSQREFSNNRLIDFLPDSVVKKQRAETYRGGREIATTQDRGLPTRKRNSALSTE